MPMRMRYVAALLAAGAAANMAMAAAPTDALSLGTLIRCEAQGRCLWADHDGHAVNADEMIRQLMTQEALDPQTNLDERLRVEEHVRYLEQVQQLASQRGLSISHRLGVNPRHLVLDGDRALSAAAFVDQEWHAAHRRRLEAEEADANAAHMSSRRLAVLDSLNWCTSNNPLGKSVCSPIKSQSKCGSCWAFAASDAIEMAVGVASNSSSTALSPQQFLDCSDRQMTATFKYCWAPNGAPGNPWLKDEMKWASKNDACDGGMTHGAFQDAAQKHFGLVSNLYLPYNETTTILTVGITGVNAVTTLRNNSGNTQTCGANEGNASASIENWKQAVGLDCAQSSDATELLKIALQQEPISVAINSGATFKDYKGGVYECPNNGEFTNGSSVDHAVVLVGYDKVDGVEYWILKNSYGSTWGDKGFLHLKMDRKINCGLNVFPVVPLGAKKGSAVQIIDGGGAKEYLGIGPSMWIILGVLGTVATVIFTALGIVVSNRRRMLMRQTHA